MSFYFFNKVPLEIGMISVLLGSIGFSGSLVFYNAYLPEIATPNLHDKVSAKGYSKGYVGASLLLIICLTLTNWSFSQCTTQGFFWPDYDVNISPVPGAQTIATNNYADNEYSIITGIVPGETYTVTAAMYITVTESDATTVINHGANSVTFTAGAGVTSIYCFWTIDAACTG